MLACNFPHPKGAGATLPGNWIKTGTKLRGKKINLSNIKPFTKSPLSINILAIVNIVINIRQRIGWGIVTWHVLPKIIKHFLFLF